MNHSEECLAARAGHVTEITDRWRTVVTHMPDEYPILSKLTAAQREAVLECEHRDHDVVRLFVSLVGQP